MSVDDLPKGFVRSTCIICNERFIYTERDEANRIKKAPKTCGMRVCMEATGESAPIA